MNKIQRIANIDQLRGIAALSVVLAHFAAYSFINNSHIPTNSYIEVFLKNILVGEYVNFGRFGVILFFVISGYVIPFSFPARNPIRGFIISRLFRLYPLFWASLTAAIIVRFYAGHHVSIYDIFANITMIPDLLLSHRILDVYWTLAYEIIFYTIVAAIYALFGPLNLATARQGALFCASVSIAISMAQIFGQTIAGGDKIILISFMFLGSVIRKNQINLNRIFDIWLFLVIITIIIGIILRGYIHYVIFVYGNDVRFENFNSIIVTHCLAIFIFIGALSWFDKFNSPSLIYMGYISYSLYITHPILMEIFSILNFDQIMIRNGLYIPILFTSTIALSAITYHFIERPFIRMGKSMNQSIANA